MDLKNLITVFRIMETECQILLCPLTSLCMELSEFLFYKSMEPWVSSGLVPCPRGMVLMEAFTCDSSLWRAGFAWAFTNLHSNHTLSQRGLVLTQPKQEAFPWHHWSFIKVLLHGIIRRQGVQGEKSGREEGIVEEPASEQVLQGWTERTSQGCS